MLYTSKRIPYGHYGMAAYKIEIDTTNARSPLQRHRWEDNYGNEHIEDWIPSRRFTHEDLVSVGYISATN